MPFVDPELGPSSYAYRPGLGVVDASQAVVALRDEGLQWVVRADIDDCFPHVSPALALRRLWALVPDHSLIDVVEALLERR